MDSQEYLDEFIQEWNRRYPHPNHGTEWEIYSMEGVEDIQVREASREGTVDSLEPRTANTSASDVHSPGGYGWPSSWQEVEPAWTVSEAPSPSLDGQSSSPPSTANNPTSPSSSISMLQDSPSSHSRMAYICGSCNKTFEKRHLLK